MFDFDVFKKPQVNLLYLGQLFSQTGEKMAMIAVTWKLTEMLAPAQASWVLGLVYLPHLILFYLAGSLVKQWGFGRTLVHTEILRAVLFLVGGFIYFKFGGGVWTLGILIFISNIFGVFFNTSLLSLPKIMVENDETRLQKLSALIDSSFSLSIVLGAVLSVVFYQAIGLVGLLLLNGGLHMVAAFLERKMTRVGCATFGSVDKEDHGFALLMADKSLLKVLVGFFVMNLFLSPIFLFLPLFVREFYGEKFSALSALEFGLAAGSLVGTFALTIFAWETTIYRKTVITMVGVAVFYLLFCWNFGLFLNVLILSFLGFFLAAANINILNWFQIRAAPESLGYTMGAVNFVTTVATPVSMVLLGLSLQNHNVILIAKWSASGLFLITLLMLNWLRGQREQRIFSYGT